MSIEKEKEAEALKTAPVKDEQEMSIGQVESEDTDTERGVVESQGPAEGTEVDAGKEVGSEEKVEADGASGTQEITDSQGQVNASGTDTTPDQEDKPDKQVAPAEVAGQPENSGETKKKKANTAEEVVANYLAKLDAIDAKARVIKTGSGGAAQDSGEKTGDEFDKPEELHWMDDIEKDVTPVRVIQSCQLMDQGRLLGSKERFRDLKDAAKILNDTSKSIEERLDAGKGRLEAFCAYFNFAQHKTSAVFAIYALMIGKFMLELKEFITGARKKDKNVPFWGVWADENLKFIGERRRQDYMYLASRLTSSIKYSFLGIERLLHITTATEHMSGDDKIGAFLTLHNIACDPGDDETKVHQFKCEVDVALAFEKTKNNGLMLDRNKLKGLIEVGGKADRKLIADCKQIAECGGDPNMYLDALTKNRGKDIDYMVDDKTVAHLLVMSERLVKGLGALVSNPSAARKVDIAKIDSLVEAIARLKEVLNRSEAS